MRFPGSLAVAVVVAAAVLYAWPLLADPALPAASDLAFASSSAHGFTAALEEGIVYPRWIDRQNHGLGSPTFLFYPPLAFYALAAIALPLDDVFLALRLLPTLLALLSGITFLIAAREHVGRFAAAAGAALYVLLPYHVLDLYDRYALAELAAFVWLPLLFLFVDRMADRTRLRAWFGFTLCCAALILTHLVSAYMAALVMLPYALVRAGPARALRVIGAMAAGGLTAALLCAFYLLPIPVHRHLVHLDCVTGGSDSPWCRKFDWRANVLYDDEVARGFERSPIKPLVENAAWSQGVVALGACLALLGIRRRGPGDAPGVPARSPVEYEKRGDEWFGRAAAGHMTVVAWTLFLQLRIAWLVWAVLPGLDHVQFPWRFQSFQVLGVCFLLSLACGSVAARGVVLGWRSAAAVALLATTVAPALILSAGLPGERRRTFDRRLAGEPFAQRVVVYEYLPQGVDWETFASRFWDGAWLGGPGEARVTARGTREWRVRVDTPEDNRLAIATFAFPGWGARLDGRPVPILRDNPLRLIEVEVPTGVHEVEIAFGSTFDRRIGSMISVLALVSFAGAWWHGGRRRAEPAA